MASNGKNPRRDIYAEVTGKIIAALEEGTAPWVRPWRSLGTSGDLRNGSSGHAYSGVNVLLLGLEMDTRGYSDSRWVTYKQARTLGGHVRKGEHGSMVIFWKAIQVRETDSETGRGSDRLKTIPVLRHYTVFNVEQCDGLRLQDRTVDSLPEPERDQACEQFLKATGADIRHGGSEAFYKRRPLDYVQLPNPKAFRDMGAYYSTAFHELTHWTGDEDRSPRTKGKRFGDPDYAREELVAELGSAFLCKRFGVDGTLQHPEYIANWLRVLRNDKKAIFQAAIGARKACEYLYGVTSLIGSQEPSGTASEPAGAAA